MLPTPDEKERREAWLYDLIHRGHAGDVAFYRRACAGATRVLELGCGSGRLLLPLARDGREVTGVDVHPGLLAQAAGALAELDPAGADRVRLVHADLRELDLAETFDRVILAYNGLFCLPGRAEMRRGLAAARRHLAPGGRLLLDVYVMDQEALAEPDDPDDADPDVDEEGFGYLITVLDGPARVDVYERDVYHPVEQRVDVTYRHRIRRRAGTESVDHSITHWYLLPGEVEPLLAEAGLRIVERHGDFEGGPFDDDSPVLVLAATSGE